MLEMLASHHFRLHGEIDMQDSSALLRELLALPASRAVSRGAVLVLDVAGISKSDSLLLAALLDLQRKLLARGARLQVTGLSMAMRGLARAYGIEALLDTMLDTAATDSSR